MRGLALLRTGFSDDCLEHSLLDGIGRMPFKLGLSRLFVACLLSETHLNPSANKKSVDYMRYGEYIYIMIDSNDFFDALSDETRRRLLALLVGDDELCVCELCHALDLPQPKVSRHLAVMRESGVLTVRREGLWIYYRIHSLLPAWAYRILDQMVQGCSGLERFQADRKRLGEMPNRPARCCA